MLDWDQDRSEVLQRIGRTPSILKILLKTKDDPFLLERWIEHHLAIAGTNNVIIFDNGSTSQSVKSVYQKFSGDILTVSFHGFHNDIHYVNKFPELYRALSQTTKYFVFLDTDEFLVVIDNDMHYDGAYVVDFLSNLETADVFPATWLYNADWSAFRFKCGHERLSAGLTWGKPILRSLADIKGYINHNIQVGPELYSAKITLNFFVLHLAELFPRQRIAANVNKLISRRFAIDGERAESILLRDVSTVTDQNIIQYVSEIRRLLPIQDQEGIVCSGLRPDCLELISNNIITYYGDSERNLLNAFLTDPDKICRKALARD